MKNLKRIVCSLGLAAAAFATAPFARADVAVGDIYSIDLVEGGLYGGRKPTEDNPLRIGETAVVRVRLLNRSFGTAGTGWRFAPMMPGGEAFKPQLGLMIGGQPVHATLIDSAEDVTSPANTYTDLYFEYTVKSGDLAMPAQLMNAAGQPASSTVSADYALKYVGATSYWQLTNDAGDIGIFHFRPAGTLPEPTDPPGEPQNYCVSGIGMGLFVKTLDFDTNYVQPAETETEKDVWRKIYQGLTTTTSVLPSLKVEGQSEAAVTMYVWSDDTAVASPLATDGARTVTDTIGGVTITRTVLPVSIPKGTSAVSFKLKGVALGETVVKLSSSEHLVADDMGVLVTNWTERVVQVVDPPAPFISFALVDPAGDPLTAAVTCPTGDGYQSYVAALVVTPSVAPDAQITVKINPEIKAYETGEQDDIFADTLLGISTTTDGTPWVNAIQEVTFEAGDNASKTLYIYGLGSSKNLASYGVKFTPSVTGPGKSKFDGDDRSHTANLVMKFAKPAVLRPTAADRIEDAMAGQPYSLDVTLSDAYKFMRADDGYTFKYRIKMGGTSGSWETIDAVSVDPESGEGTIDINFEDEGEGTLELYAVNSDPRSPQSSAHVNVPVVVSAPKKAWAEVDQAGGYYAEGETAKVKFFLSQKTPGSKTYYAFLVPVEGNADATNKFSSTGFSTSEPPTGGCVIAPGSYDSGDGFTEVAVLDGNARGEYDVFICTTPSYSKTKSAGYSAGRLIINATNVCPSVESVSMGGVDITTSGSQVTEPIAQGVNKTFRLSIGETEPSQLDKDGELLEDGTDNRFLTQWKFGTESLDWESVYGNPDLAGTFLDHEFSAPGKQVIKARVQDKDMRRLGKWSSEFTFTVDVQLAPSIRIVPTYGKTYNEGDTGDEASHFDVELSMPPKFAAAADRLVVELVVTPLGDATKYGADDCVLSKTTVTFANGVSTGQSFYLKTLDGTAESAASGFRISATATPESQALDVESKKWDVGEIEIVVKNDKPTVMMPTESVDSKGEPVVQPTSIGGEESLAWSVQDVKPDHTGMKIVWMTSEGNRVTYEQGTGTSTATHIYMDDVMTGTHTFSFGSEGDKSVTMYAEDKDGSQSVPVTIYYTIMASKRVQLRAHGPAIALGTSGGYSMHYGAAPGLGAGRVRASSVAPLKIESFVHEYSFSEQDTSVSAYAAGYKVANPVDDGTLRTSFKSWGIDSYGNRLADGTTVDAYCYTNNYNDGRHDNWMDVGYRGFDSFLYGWACNNTESSSSSQQGPGGDTTTTTQSFLLNIGDSGETILPLPEKNTTSTATATVTTDTYPVQNWEAVFSRELFAADNCGDINLDGVPDLAVYRFGMGIVDTATYKLVEGGADGNTEGDLSDLRDYNKDVDKDGNADPDFLPSTDTSAYAALIPGLKGSWVTSGRAFGARLEIRGYGDGLNDAMSQLNLAATAADRVYAEEVETKPGVTAWQWTQNCTISEVEFLAWTEFAAANGLDWTDRDAWKRWSPERPTSPVKSDTDGDGFTDGYEYYFWYRAHVGTLGADGSHHYLTGRRYDARNPGEGVPISSAVLARLMDPRSDLEPVDFPQTAADMAMLSALLGQDKDTRDTDNDGLPDALEFEIGTNPFDFDTDGDGLPDGWEVALVSNLDPCDPSSLADGLSDTERNCDGDAMAISSYALESGVKPVPLYYEHARRVTFAVIDPNGDTDGVQWYAMNEEPLLASATNAAAAWSFKVDGANYVATQKPLVTADGKTLAKTLAKGVAYLATEPAEVVTNGLVVVTDPDSGEPVVDPETGEPKTVEVAFTNYVVRALYPVCVAAGTRVGSVASAPFDLEVTTIASNVAEKAANACWIYGRGSAEALRGEVAKTAAEYGCLAIGRNLAVKRGAVVCAMPSDTRDVAFLHYLCYQEFGFDPRTAWKAKDPLATRWSKSIDGEAVEGITVLTQGGYTGAPARTRDYAAYDEFLVYSFFVNNGCDMSGETTVPDTAPQMIRIWGAFTTNPQGPGEPERKSSTSTTTTAADGTTTTTTETVSNYARGTNGADTDGDGVPDGWELYVMAGPKKGSQFVFAPPYAGFATALSGDYAMAKSFFSPFVASAKTTDTSNQIFLGGSGNDDGLNQFREFEGTDSTGYYADAAEGAEPLSTTIVHDGTWKWINKFFPTDPWNVDTDNDGLSDSAEGSSFVYGTPADDGSHWNVPGGGLNPLSVDTDRDGLPDGWEVQFKGKTPYTEENAMKDSAGNAMIDFAKDADGNPVGNALQGLVDGMDGTVADAFSYPISFNQQKYVTTYVIANGFKQVVNRDYDRDGLENWQEYLTGTMRCWRYDDPYSPWTPIPDDMYWDGDTWNPKYARLAAAYDTTVADSDEFWYKTLKDKTSPIYNPFLVTGTSAGGQYFSRVTNPWDSAFIDATLNSKRVAAYYWFKNRIGDTKIKDLWSPVLPLQSGFKAEPTKYACCSPIAADSDLDGMDDYYELFHGLNPLLGKKDGGATSGSGPWDLVADAWANNEGKALCGWAEADMTCANYWQLNPWKRPRGNGYDFEVFPWLTGIADADPDGDTLPNQEEALMPKIADVAAHTDPSALWLTDTSYAGSLTRRFFRLPTRYADVTPTGSTFVGGGATNRFDSCDGWVPESGMTPAHFGSFLPDSWSLAANGKMNWICSFEENEGFDTDHDGISDMEEKEGKFATATDPQDADSPRNRQAMYFQGPERPSALQTLPFVREEYPTGDIYPDDLSFTHFTVECWAKPDSTADATLVERAVWTGVENPGDAEYMRKNFQVGLKGGKWFAKFDPVGTGSDDVHVYSSIPASMTAWTHVAVTYDCQNLILYVNGVEVAKQPTTVMPSIGSSVVSVTTEQAFELARKSDLRAIIVGASAKTQAEGAPDGLALDVTQATGWSRYTRFYKGWIDEVRIWDGARAGMDILTDYDGRVRYTAEMAKENRYDFYDQWIQGIRRYEKGETPIPELRYHWSFDAILGAGNETALANVPHGFADTRATLTRPAGYAVGWWRTILNGYAGGCYDDPAWVNWIGNTVAHLPRFDGTTLDSVYWSTDYEGFEAAKNDYANTAEPVSRWTQMSRNGAAESELIYDSTGTRHWLVNSSDTAIYSSGTTNATGSASQAEIFKFAGRLLNQCGDDLLPLGGAYAKTCDATTGMWDNLGASSCSYITGGDSDGDGLPNWWEQYADENYRPASSEQIDWDTLVDYDGDGIAETKAGVAYLRDLERGAHLSESGRVVISEAKYESTADVDKDGMPDEWEKQNGLHANGVAGSTGHAELDPDNDGLSNYQEYLISKGAWPYGAANGFYTLSPTKARSARADQTVLDYFLPVPDGVQLSADDEKKHFFKSEYLGAICTDHDFMENWWENLYGKSYTSASIYDPHDDKDGDGWSTFAECRAYMWGSAFSADLIDRYLDGSAADNNHLLCHPQPAIGVKITYANDQIQDISGKSLVVRTSTGGTRKDATFVVHGTDTLITEAQDKILGSYYEAVPVHGFLNPGNLVPVDVKLYMAELSAADTYQWRVYWNQEDYLADENWRWQGRGTYEEYRSEKTIYRWVRLRAAELEWGDPVAMLNSAADARTGSLDYTGNKGASQQIGTVNCLTGEYELDLAKLSKIDSTAKNSVFKFAYSYKIGKNWPQTLWLSDPFVALGPEKETTGDAIHGSGRVKEGLNTIEAFIDFNLNGRYDVGEPYGMVKDVPVGWHKVPVITLELTDESQMFTRQQVTVGAGAKDDGVTTSAKVRVVRETINGVSAERVVAKTELVANDRTYLTEADVVTTKAPDLDWKFLSSDAKRLGIANVQTVVYHVEQYEMAADGTSTTIATNSVFTRSFATRRPTASPVEPTATAPVYSSAPTFRFTAGEGTTAFELQVAKADGTVIYDSGVKPLGGRSAFTTDTLGYTFTAPIYAGASIGVNGAPVLVDGENYRWRVAALNAKFRTAEESGYSAWSDFQMDVGNANRYPKMPTGHGNIAAVVRYYGPAKLKDLTNLIVVEAFENADFTGQALSQTRVFDLTDLSSVTKAISEPECANALLTGIGESLVYVRAYIDLNNNGKLDKYEPWGYANYFGVYSSEYPKAPVYNPKGISVGFSVTECENPKVATVFIEDTDLDKNEIPDCLKEDWPEDVDATTWTEWAGVSEDDADYAVDEDVMAYEVVKRTVVMLSDGSYYFLAEEAAMPKVGDAAVSCNGGVYDVVYAYGDSYGVGLQVTVTDPSLLIESVRTEVEAVLIHAQVYAKNGFNASTANATAEKQVNTKAFTADDKKHLLSYFEAMGLVDPNDLPSGLNVSFEEYVDRLAETDSIKACGLWAKYSLKPGNPDNDGDGVPDGWELYVGANPWDSSDRSTDVDNDGATLVEEYGYEADEKRAYPTDPNRMDTDGDTVTDNFYHQYLLWDPAGDKDKDGLSNDTEYLISEVFGFAKCDPRKYATNDGVCDYFKKVGELYLGEVFQDHDQVDDAWERQHAQKANYLVYDPERDDDGDGWSNYAEAKAGTDPAQVTTLGIDSYTKNEYPVPTISAHVVYNGNAVNLGSVVFKAWNEANDPNMLSAPDAIWTIGNGGAKDQGETGSTATSSETGSTSEAKYKYVGTRPDGVQEYLLAGGSIVEGSVKICFKNPNFDIVNMRNGQFSYSGMGSPSDAKWYYFAFDKGGKLVNLTTTGDISANEQGNEIGTVDYKTGRLTVDFSKFTGYGYGNTGNVQATGDNEDDADTVDNLDGSATGGKTYHMFLLDKSYVLLRWEAQAVGLSANGTYLLADADAVTAAAKHHGHVREGKTTFYCFADEDGNGEYTPGEPFGVARGVDVGWQGASFDVELTETTAITPRLSLTGAGNDRDVTLQGQLAVLLGDRTIASINPAVLSATSDVQRAEIIDQLRFAISNRVQTIYAEKNKVRVRVVRYGIDNLFAYTAGVYDSGENKGFEERVVMEKEFDIRARDYINEADFLTDTAFDIDWGTMTGEICNASGRPIDTVAQAGCKVTNMTYLVVIGDGAKDFRGSQDTNTVVYAAGAITRRFEETQSRPVCADANAICYSARPTFRWTLPGESAWAKRFGTSYTAFKLQVWDTSCVTKVYDSGVCRLPVPDKNGVFSWTADVSAGDLTRIGKTFAASGNYKWRVAMYNAKFQPHTAESGDKWSDDGRFSVAVNAQQEMNDHQYSSIDVAVKYAGPSLVLGQYTDLTTCDGKVRIQAFETADFAGEPLSETVVTSGVDDFASMTKNVRLIGLPATGTYYLRAYIDSNGNHKRDEWESWGAAKEPVVLTTSMVTAPLANVWIEDCDIDRDWLPDAWEYVKFGKVVVAYDANVKGDSETLFTTDVQAAAALNLASISTGLEGSSLTIFLNGSFANMLLGLPEGSLVSFDDIRAVVRNALDVKANTFKITSLTLGSDGWVTLAVDAEVAPSIGGKILSTVYGVTPPSGTKKVTLQVWRKKSLAQAGWGEEPFATTEVELGAGAKELRVNVGVTAEELKSGFFKIDIVE